jgi:hypothetical protein
VHINPTELKKFVEENPKLVKRRESVRWPGLYVLKYSANVFYDALWNEHDMIKYARGLVVDADYNVVVKPFTKVFNYMENGTIIDRDELCLAVRKINGFMGCATYRPEISDKIIYSTTGSLDSDFVDLIEKHVAQYENWIKSFPNSTFIFEICDETDPHIIEEELGAWLIGACTYHEDGFIAEAFESVLDHAANVFGCKRPESTYNMRFSDIVKMAQMCTHEGYMVYGDGKALKIKSPYYKVTKFLARAGETKLLKGVLSDNRYTARQQFEEEYYPLIDYLYTIKDKFLLMDEQTRISEIKTYLEKENEST